MNHPTVDQSTTRATLTPQQLQRLMRGMSPEEKSLFLWYETTWKRPVVTPKGIRVFSPSGEEYLIDDHYDHAKNRIVWPCPCKARIDACWHVHHARRAFYFGAGLDYEARTGEAA